MQGNAKLKATLKHFESSHLAPQHQELVASRGIQSRLRPLLAAS